MPRLQPIRTPFTVDGHTQDQALLSVFVRNATAPKAAMMTAKQNGVLPWNTLKASPPIQIGRIALCVAEKSGSWPIAED
jgi:hypothetical protein